jgi:hypothetical protein
VILRHATTLQRLDSIRRDGLRVRCADPQAKIKGVWLHTPSKSPWAVVHTQRKHGAALDDVVILTVSVPRKYLRRFVNTTTGYSGWYSVRDVPPRAIRLTTLSGRAIGAGLTGEQC